MSAHGRKSIYDSHYASSYTTSHFWLIAYGHERRNTNKSSTINCLLGVVMLILVGNQKRQGRSRVIISPWTSKLILLFFSHYDNLHYLFNCNEIRPIYDVKQQVLIFAIISCEIFLVINAFRNVHESRQIVFKCVSNSIIGSEFMSDTRINDSSRKAANFNALGLNFGSELINTSMEIKIS